MNGRGARRDCNCRQADQALELRLKSVDVRTDRGHPVRSERLVDVRLLQAAHVRRREIDPTHGTAPCLTRMRAGTPTTTCCGATFLVTTAPAPTVAPAPTSRY